MKPATVEWIRDNSGNLQRFQNLYSQSKSDVVLRAEVNGVLVDILCSSNAVARTSEPAVMSGLDDLARRAAANSGIGEVLE